MLGLKGKELAERVGCHPPDISDWEKSKNMPSVESLIKLARALNTTETWLVSGKNSRVAGNGDENSKIMRMPIDYMGGDGDNNTVTQMQDEMINDKRDIIELQKEKIHNLEARLAKLARERSEEFSKKLAG
ncbi:MAG: helix-turn-helix transcriptional regulator [Nitrospinae bacterium]|nr:helix-turn-helix transcriptional regulator [Nitrospinota bacterium]